MPSRPSRRNEETEALRRRPPDVLTEAVAGVTTFFTMAYIVVVNPAILSSPGTGMRFSGVLTATVLTAFTMTLLMGLYAKLPFAVAPGMGLNGFFAYTVVLHERVPWQTALGLVFWAGVLFVVISATPLRETIARAIPPGLRIAAGAGIGLFIAFIGLKNSGLVVGDPVTLVRLGPIDRRVMLSIGGLALTLFLLHRRSSLAFLSGIVVVTVAARLLGLVETPPSIVSLPDVHSVFGQLDVVGALRLSLLPTLISILFTDLFDSLATFIGVSQATGLTDDDDQPRHLKQGLLVDSFATLGAAIFGSSSGTAYIESSAGIEVGGRTGLTSVFTALCFLPCFFLAPLAGMVPLYATAPVLILVGALMFRSATRLSLDRLEDLVPSFLTVVLIPLTFSITQGILWGFITHVALYLTAGRRREIHPMMYAVGLISVGLLMLEHMQRQG